MNFLTFTKKAAAAFFCLSALSAAAGFWPAAGLFAAALVLTAPAYYCYCLFRLRKLSTAGLEETADFILGPGSALVGAFQHRAEILPFLRELLAQPPRAVAEIGRAQGGTLALLCRAASPDALVISLDLPGGVYSGSAPPLNRGFWRKPLLEALRGPGQELRLIDADSKAPAAVELFRSALGGRQLDLLFIDGDHTYEGVKADYELYSGFVKPGGVIAFHDIQPGFEDQGVAVRRFWKEYPLPGARREYIADPAQVSYGIGALLLPR